MRRPALTAAGVAAALALTGCAASSTTGATSPTSPAPSTSSSATGPGSPSPVASVVKVAGDAWSKELDGSKDLVGDWVEKKCGNFNVKTGKCGGV